MKRFSLRRPSPSLLISLIALVISMGGTALATTRLTDGDKLIAKHTLSGNRLRDHTLSGRQIDLSRLGKVPSATHADTAGTAANAISATNASHADTADSATTASTAANALALGGDPASTFQHACVDGAVAAYVYVKASATFSSTYTSFTPPLQDQFNCAGGVVEVKRVAAGVYDVHFGGLDSGAQLVATGSQTVTPLGAAVNGGEVTYKLVSDTTSSGSATVYQVRLDDPAGAAVDNEFSFALLSPQ
jgi:hypothetical protein